MVLVDVAPAEAEPDDMESVVRLLVYADLYEIEGLVICWGVPAGVVK